jgi:hypothetical protein
VSAAAADAIVEDEWSPSLSTCYHCGQEMSNMRGCTLVMPDHSEVPVPDGTYCLNPVCPGPSRSPAIAVMKETDR